MSSKQRQCSRLFPGGEEYALDTGMLVVSLVHVLYLLCLEMFERSSCTLITYVVIICLLYVALIVIC